MESLGKRQQRAESEDQDEEYDKNQGVESSSDSQDQDYPNKRQRHDSDEDEEDDRREQDQEDEDDQYGQLTEEQRLWIEAQNELMKEDELLKNMTKEEIENILNGKDDNEEQKIDKHSIKKMIQALRQYLNENLELRMKYKDEPEKFLDSEAELHSAIKEIQVISAFPQYIKDFIQSEGVQALIEILDHPNPDITNESITLLVELTEEEMLNNPEFEEVVKILIQNEIWNFIVRVLEKLDDNVDDERPQIFKCMSLLENMLDFLPEEVSNKLMHVDMLINWFLQYLHDGDVKSENYLQIAELLFTIVQNCHEEYKAKFTNTLHGMERLLAIINLYRKKRTLQLEEELEAVANIFDTISALLLTQESLDQFRKLEAFELMMSICKKQKLFRRHIIKVFDFGLSISSGVDTKKNCKHFVDKGGLPVIFAFFMMKQEVKNKPKKKKIQDEIYVKVTADEIQQDESRLLNILIGLILNTQPDEAQETGVVTHERILFKFIENDFEKLQRLFDARLRIQPA
eukprot:403349645